MAKVALSGPSGTGKTSLIGGIHSSGIPGTSPVDLVHHSSSAGDILSEEQKSNLKAQFGYSSEGHKNVISLGHLKPEFAIMFQEYTAIARKLLIENNPSLITDRSPVDNSVYYHLQASMHAGNTEFERFLANCKATYGQLTHCIYIPTSNPELWVEDNGSRISSYPFQQLVNMVFKYHMENYYIPISKSITEYRIILDNRGKTPEYTTRVLGNSGPHVLLVNIWGHENRNLPVAKWIQGVELAYRSALTEENKSIKWG